VFSLCQLYLPDLLYILQTLNQFIWQISGLASDHLWVSVENKKWISSTALVLVSPFASKGVYGGTEQISTEIQFLAVCSISEGQKFL